jgi:hypothetical protein
MGLVTIFYCLKFETSLFVASYDSATPHSYYIASARTAQKIPHSTVTPLLRVTEPLPISVCFTGSTDLALIKYASIIYGVEYTHEDLHYLSIVRLYPLSQDQIFASTRNLVLRGNHAHAAVSKYNFLH